MPSSVLTRAAAQRECLPQASVGGDRHETYYGRSITRTTFTRVLKKTTEPTNAKSEKKPHSTTSRRSIDCACCRVGCCRRTVSTTKYQSWRNIVTDYFNTRACHSKPYRSRKTTTSWWLSYTISTRQSTLILWVVIFRRLYTRTHDNSGQRSDGGETDDRFFSRSRYAENCEDRSSETRTRRVTRDAVGAISRYINTRVPTYHRCPDARHVNARYD